jgi:DNA helicase II / ATP-dependent DNA helicase PcrA
MNELEQLNDAQRQAVLHTEGPCMIIAGAGSGKTRVLTYRIAHLMREKGVDPFQILALTFTNKAAGEMRHRIESMVGTPARNLWMGTFHSIFARMLRIESERLGYPSNFSVYDTEDSKQLLKLIVKDLQLDEKVYKPSVLLNRISSAKNRLISWKEYISHPEFLENDRAAMRPEMGRIFRIYSERCLKAGAMDFDDLLYNTNLLFRDHTDVLNKYQHRFRYVLVDEFQDTNYSQYLITKKLAAVHQNICVVGDDAQSIYAFRGADIRNILNFEKDYSDLQVYRLEQNYRSTRVIVEAANSVIHHNTTQLKKSVWTQNSGGELIDLIKAASDAEEGKLIATSIFELKNNSGYRNGDFAILYRTNSQSRALEEALRRVNIGYKIVGGLSFYQRKEIKDLLAYLRFAVNQQDEQALRRIINLPKRGIGEGTVDKMSAWAEEQGANIWDVLCNIGAFAGGKAAQSIAAFAGMFRIFIEYASHHDAYETAGFIARESGLLRDLHEDKTVEGLSRYENVQELLNAIKEYVDNPETEEKGLGAFLQQVSLITSSEEETGESEEKVTLMTIHMAKGLEFKVIFLVGMEEDLFPSQMMLTAAADLEEERRLFYVAITRARERLFLSYALSRYRYGRLKNCDPSRFLEEIDPAYIRVQRKFSFHERREERPLPAKTLVSQLKSGNHAPVPPQVAHRLSDHFRPSDTNALAEGMRVEHPKFGFGRVIAMETEGANRKAKVVFDNFGEKTLLLSFAKLMIHDS